MMHLFLLLWFITTVATSPWLNENVKQMDFLEGDIIQTNKNESSGDFSGNHFGSRPILWKGKKIPYFISEEFNIKERLTILSAMEEIDVKTICIKFPVLTETQKEIDYIFFRRVGSDVGCSSFVGKIGGKQVVNLNKECIERNSILHELMHVLGFYHEHSRSDRDEYINVLLHNVYAHRRDQFRRNEYYNLKAKGLEYDYNSVTHYPENAFSQHGLFTIQSKQLLGFIRMDGLSHLDVQKIQTFYKCTQPMGENEVETESDEIITTRLPMTSVQLAMGEAINSGDVNKVLFLLHNGYNVNETSKVDNITALHIATFLGQVQIVQLLINNYADVDAQGPVNATPLHFAAEKNHSNIISILLDNYANIEANTTQLRTPLHCAAIRGNAGAILTLLNRAANIEAQDIFNYTPLHFAVQFGHENALKILLNYSANIEAKTIHQVTPLYLAANTTQQKIVQILLDHSANSNARANLGMTPLHVAAANNASGIVSLLIKHSANINEKDYRESTPLHYAATWGHLNVVKILLENSANMNAVDGTFNTPLDLAIRRRQTHIVQLMKRFSKLTNQRGNIERIQLQFKNGFADRRTVEDEFNQLASIQTVAMSSASEDNTTHYVLEDCKWLSNLFQYYNQQIKKQ